MKSAMDLTSGPRRVSHEDSQRVHFLVLLPASSARAIALRRAARDQHPVVEARAAEAAEVEEATVP